jgi:DNA-binding response OmpR family regulator
MAKAGTEAARSTTVRVDWRMPQSAVLVVDDDAATREGLKELLAHAGIATDDAGDGHTALRKLEEHDFAVVLLDVHLPGVSGLEILEWCAAKQRRPRIIVMTGSEASETVIAALRGQAYDFIGKPIDPQYLLATVRRALARDEVPAIEVLSARADWLELLVPCSRDAADRVQVFVQRLEMDLADDVRESVALAFRELLLNGIEWGGQLDPTQRVRVACLRTPRLLLYRIADPGSGFQVEDLSHASGGQGPDRIAHDDVRREKGIRPGGFGLVMIRAIADELVFNERRNEVVFIKYLDRVDAQSSNRDGSERRAGASLDLERLKD